MPIPTLVRPPRASISRPSGIREPVPSLGSVSQHERFLQDRAQVVRQDRTDLRVGVVVVMLLLSGRLGRSAVLQPVELGVQERGLAFENVRPHAT
jgi:hypothetical protein